MRRLFCSRWYRYSTRYEYHVPGTYGTGTVLIRNKRIIITTANALARHLYALFGTAGVYKTWFELVSDTYIQIFQIYSSEPDCPRNGHFPLITTIFGQRFGEAFLPPMYQIPHFLDRYRYEPLHNEARGYHM